MIFMELMIENCVINGFVIEGVDIENEVNSVICIVNIRVLYNGFGISIRD